MKTFTDSTIKFVLGRYLEEDENRFQDYDYNQYEDPYEINDESNRQQEQEAKRNSFLISKQIKFNDLELVLEPSENYCIICYSEFNDTADLVKLDCVIPHVIHFECMKKWLEQDRWECPQCTTPID